MCGVIVTRSTLTYVCFMFIFLWISSDAFIKKSSTCSMLTYIDFCKRITLNEQRNVAYTKSRYYK